MLHADTTVGLCASQVQITDFKERGLNKDLVAATVYVEQESQKGMVIGRNASALKTLGTAARADIESFLGESHCSSLEEKNTLCILLVRSYSI